MASSSKSLTAVESAVFQNYHIAHPSGDVMSGTSALPLLTDGDSHTPIGCTVDDHVDHNQNNSNVELVLSISSKASKLKSRNLEVEMELNDELESTRMIAGEEQTNHSKPLFVSQKTNMQESIKSNLSADMIKQYRREYGTEKNPRKEKKIRKKRRQEQIDQKNSSMPTPIGLVENEQYPNRPCASLWKQQKLPAWQPVYQPKWIVGSFLVFGLVLTTIGVLMLLATIETDEKVLDYTFCDSVEWPGRTCASLLLKNREQKCTCKLNFTLPHEFATPLYLYYGLHNFYQNHRRYVASVDWNQLKGQEVTVRQVEESCSPYAEQEGRVTAPCGAIANSLFSDHFTLYTLTGLTERKVTLVEDDIAWPSDRQLRYHNPPGSNPWVSMAKPVNWTSSQWNHWGPTGGYTNEHFMVWMRTAAFPTFRKLWAKVDWGSVSPLNSMPAGQYAIKIDYRYPTVFPNLAIQKEIILSNTSWLGGRNLFLPILYLSTGGVAILAAGIFLWLSIWAKRRASELAAVTHKTHYNSTSPANVTLGNVRPTVSATKSQMVLSSTEDISDHTHL